MKQAKRKVRTYKATDDVYKKSQRRAKKEKTNVSKQVEVWLSWYSSGSTIVISPDY